METEGQQGTETTVDAEEEVTINNANMEDVRDENETVNQEPTTLIDMIVAERVEKKITSMQQELDRYKQELTELKSKQQNA